MTGGIVLEKSDEYEARRCYVKGSNTMLCYVKLLCYAALCDVI